VSGLEERINACDSIYRLAAQTNAIREKERRDQHAAAVRQARALQERVFAAEDRVTQLPQFIKDIVRQEVRRHQRLPEFEARIQEARDQLSERMTTFESQFVQTARRTQKTIKKINADVELCKAATAEDGQVEEITLQVSELKRRQQTLLDLLNAIRSQGDQDFDGVNSQLTGLWAQLSAKRTDTPIRKSR
jgi:predicted  nucleic acid-binding Zn-ribbon protein